MSAPPPAALSIAGSDPSGGAGIQADLKTFSALGAYGMCVITALTAQNTRGVTAVHTVPVDMVAAQVDALLDDVRVDAVKIGMLATAEIADTVAYYLRPGQPLANVHVVLDPVMVATSGDRLLDDDAVAAVRALLPRADVVTPNLAEAAVLTELPVPTTPAEMDDLAAALMAMGARRVLLKGGHLASPDAAVDVWRDADGTRLLHAPRIATTNTHGTGCTLSSALAALRPQRPDWQTTVRDAKQWLTEALRHADVLQIGHGHGPVHHFHAGAQGWRS